MFNLFRLINLGCSDAGRYRFCIRVQGSLGALALGVRSSDSIGLHVMIASAPVDFTMISVCFS